MSPRRLRRQHKCLRTFILRHCCCSFGPCRERFSGANAPFDRIASGPCLADWGRVAIASRIRMLLQPTCAVWLVALSALPFTAPFRTCDISVLFGGRTMSSKASLPAAPVEAASRDGSLQPSALAAARLRFPGLTAGGEHSLVASPRVTPAAPPLPTPHEGAHEARLFVLRI